MVPYRYVFQTKIVPVKGMLHVFHTKMSHQGYMFCQILVTNSLLITPMVPLRVCFSTEMVPLIVRFFAKNGPTEVNVYRLQS